MTPQQYDEEHKNTGCSKKANKSCLIVEPLKNQWMVAFRANQEVWNESACVGQAALRILQDHQAQRCDSSDLQPYTKA
jgi:hypothetical protein